MVVGSARISGAGVTDLHKYQSRLHGIDLNLWSGSELIGMKAVTIWEDSFPVRYPYEFHCSSMDEVSEKLRKTCPYCFDVRDSHAMKAIENQKNGYLSKNTSEQYRKEAERLGWR